MGQRRVAVLFDNLGPYHIARLEAFHRRCEALQVIEYRETSSEYAWQPAHHVPFERVTLSDKRRGERSDALRKKLENSLAAFQPSAIAVPGWASWLALNAIHWAHNNFCPVIVMSDSQEGDFKRVFWKEAVKRRLLKFSRGALVGGTPHRDYLRQLGMPSDAILTGYDVVDNDYFARRAAKVRERASLRRRDLGLPERYFLCSARFIPKKNLVRLLRAFAFFLERNPTGNSEGAAWHLVLLGDGPLRAEVEASIHSLGLSNRVHLAGFRQIEELPAFYALAECLILPSTTEQWGLVVNEAMACGLPVLGSERCGCAPDLVENGRNGFTFDPYDVNALADLMGKIASGHCDRSAMGEASREIISQWSPETFATGLGRAVEATFEAPPRATGMLDRALLWALSRR